MNQYHKQADAFLEQFGINCRITLSDTKPAPWEREDAGQRHHYRVTLSKPRNADSLYRMPVKNIPQKMRPNRLVFDFWGSENDCAKGEHPHAYDVLSCISSDAYCPETFKDFCGDYGYDDDSITALQTFRRMDRFGKRLRQFFNATELTALSEIQ